jgi:hypothetical protein
MDKQDDNPQTAVADDALASNGQVMDIQPPKSINVTDEGSIEETSNTSDSALSLPVEPSPPSGADEETESATSSGSTSNADPLSSTQASASVFGDSSGDSSASVSPDSPVPPPSSGPSMPPDAGHSEGVMHDGEHHGSNPMAIPPNAAHHSSGTPITAVVIAIVVALAIAGGVIFAYTKNKDTSDSDTATNTSTQTAPKPQASVSDVDATDKEIDASLSKADEATDFPTAELSDTSLGL